MPIHSNIITNLPFHEFIWPSLNTETSDIWHNIICTLFFGIIGPGTRLTSTVSLDDLVSSTSFTTSLVPVRNLMASTGSTVSIPSQVLQWSAGPLEAPPLVTTNRGIVRAACAYCILSHVLSFFARSVSTFSPCSSPVMFKVLEVWAVHALSVYLASTITLAFFTASPLLIWYWIQATLNAMS